MKIGSILSWPFRLVDRINPLAPASRYFLRNAPTLWRTSLVKILWYLLLAHVALWFLGWWTAEHLMSLPTRTEMVAFHAWILPISIAIGVGWALTTWRVRIIDRRWRALGITLAIYFGFFYGLATLTQAYSAPYSLKVARLYDAKFLWQDAAALDDPLAQICGEEGASDVRAAFRRIHKGRVHSEVLELGLEKMFAVDPPDCSRVRRELAGDWYSDELSLDQLLTALFDVRDRSLGLRDSAELRNYISRTRDVLIAEMPNDGDLDRAFYEAFLAAGSAQLDGRLAAAQEAAKSHRMRHGTRYVEGLLRPAAAFFAFLLAAGMLYAEVHRAGFERWWVDAGQRLRRPWRNRPGPISRLNSRFLRTRPRIWQLRLPAAALTVGVVAVFGWFAGEITDWIFDLIGEFNRFGLDDDTFEIGFAIVYSAILVFVGIALMQSQRRYFELDIRARGAGVRFFLALFLPPYLACVLIVLLLSMTQDRGFKSDDLLVWYGAPVLAFWAATFSWSVTFVGLRRGLTQLGVAAGVTSAMVFFIAFLNISDDEFAVVSYFWIGLLLVLWGLLKAGKAKFLVREIVLTTVIYSSWFASGMMLIIFNQLSDDSLDRDYLLNVLVLGFVPALFLLAPLFTRMQALATEPRHD